MLIDAMMRINEATSLRVSEFDFGKNEVTIRAAFAKSRKTRTIPIKPVTARVVKRLIEANEDFFTDYVFLTNYGEPIDRDDYRKRLNEHAQTAKIKKNVHPHILRHSAAPSFLEAGGELRHLQMMLGHSDLRMVVRYTHLSNRALQSQHSKYSAVNRVTSKMSRPRKRKL
ncbi:tyrosine-type recombinase/integrase [Halobacillus halophilus]|nr:tyrosine-type recombinase/integrase [Halobacillus halophilus]